jgi:hypothetical protein
MKKLSYVQGSDLGDSVWAWRDSLGALIDFSVAHTYELKVGYPGSAALFTKTTGITGSATSPNITISWATTGELNTLAPGQYRGQLRARRTSDSRDRYLTFILEITPAIT